MVNINTNMNLCCGLWVKETLHCAPKKSESWPSINDEHSTQCLQKQLHAARTLINPAQNFLQNYNQYIVHPRHYLRVVITINLLKLTNEVSCSFAELFHPLKMYFFS
ncbi:Os02g0443001 [Oryza sativa Japonica Group]|uniref:Os02g0443001 protein n=1 Tax=Oryza sativa subsp. japonica TaxID=39947 RepID=A0A0P0VIJ9_ORYSJ|nr:hypothetical protein EE612_011004 [Oryza sativa]BAS78487.1 Os02g0443001 [Oryza sativa Japonica Group]